MSNRDCPLVSVIIPVYNAEKYIGACIQSVIRQTYREIEIIVVNDGSSDQSATIIERYRRLDDRIFYIDKQNEGLPVARRTGIDNAHGKYIQHLDSDDTLIEEAIENLVRRAEETSADIVAAPFFFCYPEEEPELSVPLGFDILSNIEYFREILHNRAYWSVWSNFQKRSLFLDFDIECVADISFGEDAILMIQLIFSAKKIASLNIPIINYNRYPTSMSFLPSTLKYKDFRSYQVWIEQYVGNKGIQLVLNADLALMHLQTTFQSIYWKQFDDFDKDMKRLIKDLKLYPDLRTSLSRRESKIVNTYKISPYLGHLRLLYYCKRGKI